MINTKKFELMASKISKLENNHHIEILRIIKQANSNVNISENSNGCFLSMNELNDTTIMKIEQYINFHENREKELNEYISIKNDMIENLKN